MKYIRSITHTDIVHAAQSSRIQKRAGIPIASQRPGMYRPSASALKGLNGVKLVTSPLSPSKDSFPNDDTLSPSDACVVVTSTWIAIGLRAPLSRRSRAFHSGTPVRTQVRAESSAEIESSDVVETGRLARGVAPSTESRGRVVFVIMRVLVSEKTIAC